MTIAIGRSYGFLGLIHNERNLRAGMCILTYRQEAGESQARRSPRDVDGAVLIADQTFG
jgi:hypothetical protein